MTDTMAAILLGILEGLTEFLPVSSTGHLILATELLGFDQREWEVFNIAIQPAAILAIVVLYWRTFWDVAKGLFGLEKGALAFVRNLLVAFFPAVLLGLAFGDIIEGFLGNAVLVCWTLIIGGVAILAIERWANPPATGPGVAGVPLRTAILIGVVQCLAMIPGVSRSGATILGAMAFGVDRKTAAEFSFFLAVPTLSGATVYQLAKYGSDLTARDLELIGIGSLAGFVVALVVVKLFIAIVTKIGFAPFAWYRIVVGAGGLVWLTLV
ncbi:undecaprenyl-diphosphate phosphatase [Porphyrobacter sp. CACIAM 03H1]|uniref:undecaprenyl-diphosphate phosphatase n=1 Tax=Porphyrobacter sp. CACIAM 03H1 TaxID=2003315 RepID=UPI000B5A8623|nr:undecaprenyl-diphosphate phosphatase [Porphyrobacter sp. CACIAM 03H1]ASJ90047.1 undecaprenyl-diphosphatase [Porphyrobacter sp. CACIAM 03H1]